MSNQITIGVDEVGRGCVYGPLVVAAAAVIPGSPRISGVRDSKDMKESARYFIEPQLRKTTYHTVACIDAKLIEQFGIRQCVLVASQKAFTKLLSDIRTVHADAKFKVMLDGTDWNDSVPMFRSENPGVEFDFMAKADSKVYECSAASIIAKVNRDRWITDICTATPELSTRYDLLGNKGYGTPKHKAGLQKYGLTEHHRSGFCRSLLQGKGNGKGTPAEQLSLFST